MQPFIVTTAIKKMLRMKARKKAVQGGTSSGKTYGIIPILIDKAARTPGLKITIVAESIPAVKDGAVDIFQSVMMNTGRWIEENWIGNPMRYKFINGSVIQFKSFDTVGKAKAAGKRDVLFLNECNHIPYQIAHALMIRSKEIWLDYNPDNEFWVHTEVMTGKNSESIILTYKDNEACPAETVEDLEESIEKAFFDPKKDWKDQSNVKNTYWANWCKVYVSGEIGNLEGVVFTNWSAIDAVPSDARVIGYGLDFGYSVDPTSCVVGYEFDGELIFDELIYETGLTNPEIADRLTEQGIQRFYSGYGDSAEPKSIRELSLRGLNVSAVKKGADSIRYGIEILQQRPFKVTARSVNLIRELRSYLWETDRDGNKTGKPIGKADHAIDAMRYLALMKLGKKETVYIGR